MRLSKQTLKRIIKEEISKIFKETISLGYPVLTRSSLRTMTDEDLQAQISGVDMSDPAQSALLKRLEAERSRRDRMVQLQALRLGNSPRRGHAAIPLEEKESTS